MDLDKTIKSRKSVRKFKDIKPDWRKIIECIDSCRYAPIAGKNYTLKFILTNNEEKIRSIAEASQQPFINEAKYVLIVCSDCSRLVNSYKERGKIYCRQQAGAAIQNFLLKIEEVGLSTCWIGHFVENQIKIIFKIPKELNVEAIFPIGYEYKKRMPREKIDIDRILFFEEYGNKKMKDPKKIEV
jgi:nitroreductase